MLETDVKRPDREHRRRRQRRRAALRRAGGPVGRADRATRAGSTSASASTPATRTPPERTLGDAVERAIAITGGIDLLHANDSRDAAGTGADRHTNLGAGQIDLDALRAMIAAGGLARDRRDAGAGRRPARGHRVRRAPRLGRQRAAPAASASRGGGSRPPSGRSSSSVDWKKDRPSLNLTTRASAVRGKLDREILGELGDASWRNRRLRS